MALIDNFISKLTHMTYSNLDKTNLRRLIKGNLLWLLRTRLFQMRLLFFIRLVYRGVFFRHYGSIIFNSIIIQKNSKTSIDIYMNNDYSKKCNINELTLVRFNSHWMAKLFTSFTSFDLTHHFEISFYFFFNAFEIWVVFSSFHF